MKKRKSYLSKRNASAFRLIRADQTKPSEEDVTPDPQLPSIRNRGVNGCAVRIYGVTGQSGSGKSRFAGLLAEKLGCERIDIDRIGHLCLEDPEIIARIREHFGEGVFDADGRVIRKEVGKIVFSSDERMEEYVGMTKDFIVRSLDEITARIHHGPVVFEWVRLPVTPKYWELSSPKILVKADREMRKKTVLERDGISEEYFEARDTQGLDYDAYTYDFVVENDYRPETLERAAERIAEATVSAGRG